MGVSPGVAVAAEVDPGNDSLGDREAFSADRVADGAHAGFQGRHASDFHGGQIFEGAEILKLDERQVTVVGDMLHSGDVLLRGTPAGDENAPGVRNDMGIGENLVGADDEAGSGSALETARIPWSPVIGGLGGDFDFHH